MNRIEVITGEQRRRRYTADEKAALVTRRHRCRFPVVFPAPVAAAIASASASTPHGAQSG